MWETVLIPLKNQKLDVVELGCFEGRATVWLCENVLTHPESKITCVDTFKGDDTELQTKMNWDEIRKNFDENTAPYKNKVNLYVGSTINYLKDRKEDIDIIYIDANHTSAGTLIDAVQAHLLLRENGLIIFDDYLWGQLFEAYNLPKAAINAFMACFAPYYNPVSIGYQVILQRKKML